MTTNDNRMRIGALSDILVSTFKPYAKYTIQDRALPDARDGLKPAQRRLLWTMTLKDINARSGTKHVKSARVAGATMGKFHPHGSSYDVMVKMAQTWKNNYILVDGKGNFGSLDGDGPAADRYTEARLSKYSDEVFFYRNLDPKDAIVPFQPNYDGTLEEPEVLPARLPNLLINGAEGIAVGMATAVPTFNLSELCDALVSLIEGRDRFEQLIKLVPAPDFPTGGLVEARQDELRKIYETGRGRLLVRGKISVHSGENGTSLVITEIPYGLKKEDLVKDIGQKSLGGQKTVKDPRTGKETVEKIEARIKGVKNVLDLSGGKNGEVYIEVQITPGHNPAAVANQLFKHSKLQQAVNANITVIIDDRPVQTGAIGLLQNFLAFREGVVRQELTVSKERAQKRLHILQGRLKALSNIDRVVDIIRNNSTDRQLALLGKEFKLTKEQIMDIREMPLKNISKLEIGTLKDEASEKEEVITQADKLLNNRKEMLAALKSQFLELKERMGRPRRTEILSEFVEIKDLDTVTERDVLLIVTDDNRVKITSVDEYRVQRRGGRGSLGIEVPEGTKISLIDQISTHDILWFITNYGNRYILSASRIPVSKKAAKPKPISDYIEGLAAGEVVIGTIVVDQSAPEKMLVMLNAEGMIKKMSMGALLGKRVTTTRIFPVQDQDLLVSATVMDDSEDILISSTKGQGLRFALDTLRVTQSLDAGGVRSIELVGADKIVGVTSIKPEDQLLFITDLGFAKRVHEADVPAKKGRVGRGVRVSPESAGLLIEADTVTGSQLLIMTTAGQTIRMNMDDIGMYHRTAKGQRLQKLKAGAKLAAAAQVNVEEPTED